MTFGSNVQPRRRITEAWTTPWKCRCGEEHKGYISRCSRCRDPRPEKKEN